MKKIKVLNGYAGLGGNRKLWNNVEVTAIEIDPKIAKIYQEQNPEDYVIVGDAHQYLINHFEEYDFVWLSPPCQKNSKMVKFTRHKTRKYADLRLYQYVILLDNFFKGKWVVENVIPYYKPLIEPTVILGRHLIWSNYAISNFSVKSPKGFINKSTVSGSEELKKWLGINYEGNIYYNGNHCPSQVLRNCVHPELGAHIFNEQF